MIGDEVGAAEKQPKYRSSCVAMSILVTSEFQNSRMTESPYAAVHKAELPRMCHHHAPLVADISVTW